MTAPSLFSFPQLHSSSSSCPPPLTSQPLNSSEKNFDLSTSGQPENKSNSGRVEGDEVKTYSVICHEQTQLALAEYDKGNFKNYVTIARSVATIALYLFEQPTIEDYYSLITRPLDDYLKTNDENRYYDMTTILEWGTVCKFQYLYILGCLSERINTYRSQNVYSPILNNLVHTFETNRERLFNRYFYDKREVLFPISTFLPSSYSILNDAMEMDVVKEEVIEKDFEVYKIRKCDERNEVNKRIDEIFGFNRFLIKSFDTSSMKLIDDSQLYHSLSIEQSKNLRRLITLWKPKISEKITKLTKKLNRNNLSKKKSWKLYEKQKTLIKKAENLELLEKDLPFTEFEVHCLLDLFNVWYLCARMNPCEMHNHYNQDVIFDRYAEIRQKAFESIFGENNSCRFDFLSFRKHLTKIVDEAFQSSHDRAVEIFQFISYLQKNFMKDLGKPVLDHFFKTLLNTLNVSVAGSLSNEMNDISRIIQRIQNDDARSLKDTNKLERFEKRFELFQTFLNNYK